jgi:hypothetical protein
MVHPIDVQRPRDGESPTPGGRSGWWVLFSLLIVLALVVALIIGLSGGHDGQDPQTPAPSEAPANPGL